MTHLKIILELELSKEKASMHSTQSVKLQKIKLRPYSQDNYRLGQNECFYHPKRLMYKGQTTFGW
jgi:hypothetical protein